MTIEASAGGLQLSTTAGQQVNLLVNGAIEVTATGLSLSAASKLAVSAGQVTVDAGMVKVSGVIKCDTLVANAIVAASYSPGAGNVM